MSASIVGWDVGVGSRVEGRLLERAIVILSNGSRGCLAVGVAGISKLVWGRRIVLSSIAGAAVGIIEMLKHLHLSEIVVVGCHVAGTQDVSKQLERTLHRKSP